MCRPSRTSSDVAMLSSPVDASASICQNERLRGRCGYPEICQMLPWQPRSYSQRCSADVETLYGTRYRDSGTAICPERKEVWFCLVNTCGTCPDYVPCWLTRRHSQEAGGRPYERPLRLPSPELLFHCFGNSGEVLIWSLISSSPDGQRLASAAWDSGIRLWIWQAVKTSP